MRGVMGQLSFVEFHTLYIVGLTQGRCSLLYDQRSDEIGRVRVLPIAFAKGGPRPRCGLASGSHPREVLLQKTEVCQHLLPRSKSMLHRARHWAALTGPWGPSTTTKRFKQSLALDEGEGPMGPEGQPFLTLLVRRKTGQANSPQLVGKARGGGGRGEEG